MQQSLTVALERVLKVYKSCYTTSQYVRAVKYQRLFENMYKMHYTDIVLYREISDMLDEAKTECLKYIQYRAGSNKKKIFNEALPL